MKNHRFVPLRQLALALLAGAALGAAAATPDEESAAGTWYGEFAAGADRPLQRFLTTRHADGTYTLVARVYDQGKMVEQVQNQGMWGVSNGMYFTYTTLVNGENAQKLRGELANIYVLKRLTADEMEYQHVAHGTTFRVRRTDPASAKLPD